MKLPLMTLLASPSMPQAHGTLHSLIAVLIELCQNNNNLVGFEAVPFPHGSKVYY